MQQFLNFKSVEGSLRYTQTAGTLVSPQVALLAAAKLENTLADTNKRVLDVACGPGTLALMLAGRHPQLSITGVDSSEAMIAQCEKRAEAEHFTQASFQVMDANELTFEDESFDAVFCNLAYPFFADPLSSLQGMLRVLKKGGQLIATVPGRRTWREFFDVVREEVGPQMPLIAMFSSKLDKAATLPDTMEHAGFVRMKVIRNMLPFSLESGASVMEFFEQMFPMMSQAPAVIRGSLEEAINRKNPSGFEMHYESVLAYGEKDV